MSKNKTFDEQMEKYIGDVGNTDETMCLPDSEPSFGKLKSANDLTQDEQREKNIFLQSTNNIRKQAIEQEDYYNSTGEPLVLQGWVPVDRGEMGIRSMFYPQDWEFRIKPATTIQIRNWASIDEENISQVNNVMNEILKTCVSVNSEYGKVSWEKINSWDRFWFILKVQQYTFKTGENKIEFEDDCNECGESLLFTLRPDTLFYEFPDDDVVNNCWNMEKMQWDINPNEYDVVGRPLTLYTPTVGKDNALIQWAYAQNQQGKKLDEVFLKFLPYMLERPIKDMNVLDRKIKEIEKEFKSWSTDMFMFMDEVVRNITINPSEKLRQTCEHCGAEVTSNVQFPNGIRRLFVVQSKHRKFGSR